MTFDYLVGSDDPQRPIMVGSYIAPAQSVIRVEDGKVYWPWKLPIPVEQLREVRPRVQTFIDFVNLGCDENEYDKDILRFVKRWGPLNVCETHLTPIDCWPHVEEVRIHHIGGALRGYGDEGEGCEKFAGTGEPTAAYRKWAKNAGALLRISDRLADGKLGDAKDWETLEGWLAWGSTNREWLNPGPKSKTWHQPISRLRPGSEAWTFEALRIERGLVASFVNVWLLLGSVRPELSQHENGLMELKLTVSGLFGALAVRLLETAGRYTVDSCTGCGRFFDATPDPDDENARQRRPKIGQGRYCRDCVGAGVPVMLAKRRQALGLSKSRQKKKRKPVRKTKRTKTARQR